MVLNPVEDLLCQRFGLLDRFPLFPIIDRPRVRVELIQTEECDKAGSHPVPVSVVPTDDRRLCEVIPKVKTEGVAFTPFAEADDLRELSAGG